MNEIIHNEIKEIVTDNEIVLFMKGTPEMPQCGFSATVVNVLNALGVSFVGINILEDEELRQAIKEYSDWPTIPQLYINAEFVGGCDIVKEMYENGELRKLLNDATA
jgi:monothiol glutaredoxin